VEARHLALGLWKPGRELHADASSGYIVLVRSETRPFAEECDKIEKSQNTGSCGKKKLTEGSGKQGHYSGHGVAKVDKLQRKTTGFVSGVSKRRA